MSDSGEYPKAVYRPGDEGQWDGVMMDFGTVSDPSDEEEAVAAGWYLHPSDFPDAASVPDDAKGGLLDQNARDIEKVLPTLSLDDLEKLKADETAGKSRSGVLRDIEKAINAKLEG